MCEENSPREAKYEFKLGQKYKTSITCEVDKTCVKREVKPVDTGTLPCSAKQSLEDKLV